MELREVKNHVLLNAQSYIDKGYAGYRITSDYEPVARVHPVLGTVRPHPAIDLVGAYGYSATDYIIAIADGEVVSLRDGVSVTAGSGEGKAERVKFLEDNRLTSGNFVQLKHDNNIQSRYIHLANGTLPKIKVGDKVKKGNKLGYMGNTGMANGSHLHIEIIVDGKHVDPKPYLLGEKNIGGEIVGYIKLEKDLKLRDRGEEVKLLQLRMIQLSEEFEKEVRKHSFTKTGDPDGGYGDGMFESMKKFQRLTGLKETGNLDSQTREVLNRPIWISDSKELQALERENALLEGKIDSLRGAIDTIKNF